MTDEICGAECVDGSECQNPAGSCPVSSHSDDETAADGGNPRGRPEKFTDERARAAISAAELGKSIRGCERDAGVAHGTLSNWLDQNLTFEGPEGKRHHFFPTFRRARGEGETYYIEEGGDPEGAVETSFARFMLSSSYGYQPSERQEVDMDADHTIDTAEGVSAEFVTYNDDEHDE